VECVLRSFIPREAWGKFHKREAGDGVQNQISPGHVNNVSDKKPKILGDEWINSNPHNERPRV
jgi:hypothetical protein